MQTTKGRFCPAETVNIYIDLTFRFKLLDFLKNIWLSTSYKLILADVNCRYLFYFRFGGIDAENTHYEKWLSGAQE